MMDSAGRSRPRIALLVLGFPSAASPAAGIFNLRAAKLLSGSADVTVIHLRTWLPSRRPAGISEYDGIRVLTLAVPQVPHAGASNVGLYARLGWPLVRAHLRSCDLIHSVSADFCGVIAARWAKSAGLPHVTQVTGSDIPLLRRRSKSLSLQGRKHRIDLAVCNSAGLAKDFSVLYPDCPVEVVYRGTDLARFHPGVSALGPLASAPPVRFLFMGGFYDYRSLEHGANTKGGYTLLEAWQQAEKRMAELGTSLALAGIDSQCEVVRTWRSRLLHPERVHLMGMVAPSDVPGVMCACDAFLVPSLQEGLPNAAVEAGACGRAVFGSDTDGLPEVIAEGETGRLLPPRDAEAWSLALVAAARDSAMLRRMGDHARLRMEKVFNADEYPQKMMRIYKSLLSRTPGSAAGAKHTNTQPECVA